MNGLWHDSSSCDNRHSTPRACLSRLEQPPTFEVDPASLSHCLAVTAFRCLAVAVEKHRQASPEYQHLILGSGALSVALFASVVYPVSTDLHRLALEVSKEGAISAQLHHTYLSFTFSNSCKLPLVPVLLSISLSTLAVVMPA